MAIRPCSDADLDAVLAVVNAAATAYDGVIPADCFDVPYMSAAELRAEIGVGVRFWGLFDGEEEGRDEGGVVQRDSEQLLGVMGIQDVADVTLIRHAYVLPAYQKRGIGGRLLAHLLSLPQPAGALRDRDASARRRPVLVGTWADAVWAVRFYERHGFRLVTLAEKDRLLRRYWRIPERQVATSVVLRWEEDAADSLHRPVCPDGARHEAGRCSRFVTDVGSAPGLSHLRLRRSHP